MLTTFLEYSSSTLALVVVHIAKYACAFLKTIVYKNQFLGATGRN